MLCLSPYLFSQRAAKVGSLPRCAVLGLPGRRHPRPSWRLYSYAWQRSMVSEYKVSQKKGDPLVKIKNFVVLWKIFLGYRI